MSRAQQTVSIHTKCPWDLESEWSLSSPGSVSTKKVPAFSVPMTVFLMKWEKSSFQRDSNIVSAAFAVCPFLYPWHRTPMMTLMIIVLIRKCPFHCCCFFLRGCKATFSLLGPDLFVSTLSGLWCPGLSSVPLWCCHFPRSLFLRLSLWFPRAFVATGVCLPPPWLPPCTQSAVPAYFQCALSQSAVPVYSQCALSLAVCGPPDCHCTDKLCKGHSQPNQPSFFVAPFWVSKNCIRCTCLYWMLNCLLLSF